MENFDIYCMREAISLARGGNVKRNPYVGAVFTKNNKIIARGYHREYGKEHAEIMAINNLNSIKPDALYVNLEPCSHYGKTPPCADEIIKTGVKEVFVGMEDPNPKVCGRGIKKLRDNNIKVHVGLLEDECRELNKKFIYSILNKLPYVTYKSAMSLDGKIATVSGKSKWISSELSRDYSMRLRAQNDGIMVGINTVLTDDPSLNLRNVDGENPTRIVIDSSLRMPRDARMLNLSGDTIIFSSKFGNIKNAEVIVCGKDRVDLKSALSILYERNISSILLEGGGTLAFSLFDLNLINEVKFFIAPIILGGSNAKTPVGGAGFSEISDGALLRDISLSEIGGDVLLEARCLQD